MTYIIRTWPLRVPVKVTMQCQDGQQGKTGYITQVGMCIPLNLLILYKSFLQSYTCLGLVLQMETKWDVMKGLVISYFSYVLSTPLVVET